MTVFYIEFEEKFSKNQASYTGVALTEAEKLTDESGHRYMHFQAKDKKEIIDYYEYYGEDRTRYIVAAYINSSDDTAVKNMLFELAASFRLGAIDADTYDLSNVVNGMRTVRDDTYKVSFKLPADFEESVGRNAENEFMFIKYDGNKYSGVRLGIYSKTEKITAELLANNDHDIRQKNCSPDFSKFSDVEKIDDGRFRYTHIITGSSQDDSYCVDEFIDNGDYVYNFSITLESEDKALAEQIISSLTIETLDSAEIGKLIRNDLDENVFVTNKINSKYTFKLPSTWNSLTESGSGANAAVCVDSRTGSMITATVQNDSSYTKGNMRDIANFFSSSIEEDKNNKIVNHVNYSKIDDAEYAHFTYSVKNETGGVYYTTVYLRANSGEMIIFTLNERDIYYHKTGNEAFLNAIKSLTKA